MILEKSTDLPKECIGAISIFNLLRQTGMNEEEQITLFSDFEIDKKELSGFRKCRKILQTHFLEVMDKGSIFTEVFELRKQSAEKYSNKIDLCQDLQTPKPIIYDSLIHMHCNRLLGRSKTLEQKAYLYVLHTLKSLRFHLENSNKTP
jgi:thiopeptide-type bacteriocin biosynthesis protein